MFKKISVEGVPLTRDFVQSFAALPALPGEREVKPARLEYLLLQLRDGRFCGPDWAIGWCLDTQTEYRLDGQHTGGKDGLLNHLPADVPFPEGLLATVARYEFESIELDGAALFNLFNHPKSARTNEDVMGLYRASQITLTGFSRKFLVAVGNGVAEYEKGLKASGASDTWILSPRERGIYFSNPARTEYVQVAEWLAGFSAAKNAGFLNRPAIVAEMIKHWMTNASAANQFWSYVFSENHPEPDHHTRTLAQTYREWGRQKKYKPFQYRSKAATAWKHYLREMKGATASAQDLTTPQMSFDQAPPSQDSASA